MAPTRARLPWIDHLRTLVIGLVVHMHACVTYSHVGDWYLKSGREPGMAAKVPFFVWQGLLQSFFMGLLFFFAGYFTAGSLARRGPAAFLRERLGRLGVPALIYMLAIHPFILLGLNPWHAPFGPPGAFYWNYVRSGRFLGSSGPLWFAVALLAMCAVLAAAHAFFSRRWPAAAGGAGAAEGVSGAVPRPALLLAFALVLGLGTFAVRLVQPLGTQVLNLQLGYFVQYVAFFAAGLHAARHGWLAPLAASAGARTAGWLAVGIGPVALLALMYFGIKAGELRLFFGGPHWQALGLALWEQFAGVGLSLGLLALGARRLDGEDPRLRWLADRSFAVYVLHAPILVALTMLFRPLPQNPYGLVLLLTVAGLLASFLVADLVRRLPGVRAVL